MKYKEKKDTLTISNPNYPIQSAEEQNTQLLVVPVSHDGTTENSLSGGEHLSTLRESLVRESTNNSKK